MSCPNCPGSEVFRLFLDLVRKCLKTLRHRHRCLVQVGSDLVPKCLVVEVSVNRAVVAVCLSRAGCLYYHIIVYISGAWLSVCLLTSRSSTALILNTTMYLCMCKLHIITASLAAHIASCMEDVMRQCLPCRRRRYSSIVIVIWLTDEQLSQNLFLTSLFECNVC